MKQCLFILFGLLFVSFLSQAQNQLKGRVIDEKTGEPLEFVSVFLNTTSVGALTNAKGEFTFATPNGKYELIVSYTGYEPIVLALNLSTPTPPYLFKLSPRENALQEVAVTAKRDQSWHDNLAIFKEHFLGRSFLGQQCVLKNPEVLIINFEPKTGLLEVTARDLLLIDNPALGYQIKYLLQEFKYFTRAGYVSFLGYPNYSARTGSKAKMQRWEKNRLQGYYGSLMHFGRALYNQQLEADGFNLRRLYRFPNPDRPTEEQLQAARKLLSQAEALLTTKQKDSLYAILQKATLPKIIEQLDKNPVPYSEYITLNETEMVLSFPQYLQVVYTGEKEELAYARARNPFKTPVPGFQTSVFTFQPGVKQVSLYKNGSLDEPLALMFEGYWGWEKLGEMLPLDYEPTP